MSPKYDFARMDASDAVFFTRQLEVIRPQLFEVTYPELKGRRLVPINTTIHPGAEEYTYRVYDRVGVAKLVADYANDFPRVDILGTESTQKIRSIGDSYGWSIQEARAAQMAQLNLDVRKAMAARAAIELLIDEILLVGSTSLGVTMEGLFNLTGVNTYTVPNGVAGSPLWANKTPGEILADAVGMVSKVYTDSNEVESPDTLVLPTDSHGLMATLPIGDGDNRTVLSRFLADSQHIRFVETSHRLNTAGSGGGRRMVAYKRDPNKLEGLLPQDFEQMPPQYEAMQVVTFCHARVGGVVSYFPKSIIYADGI